MHLWITGFLKGDDEDDSLQFDLTVEPEHESNVLGILSWDSFDNSPGGEWLLNNEQVK